MSKPQVTITLGRSGKVVKRGGSVPGSKRSMGERSANDADDMFLSMNKRRRGGVNWSSGGDGIKAYQVGRNDLRLKLMRKSQSKRTGLTEERKRTDLHQKLSKNFQHSETHNKVQHRPAPKETSLLRQVRPRESADDLYLVHSRRKPSSLHIDGLRARSPDGLFNTSRGVLPPRYFDEMRPLTSTRKAHVSRDGGCFLKNDMAGPYRPTTGSLPVKMIAFPEPGKTDAQLAPPISGTVQKTLHMGEEPPTVTGLLHSLGLGKYAIHFRAEEIDMTALRQMGDKDLKELGIPMGPRKKILLALLPRFRRPLPTNLS